MYIYYNHAQLGAEKLNELGLNDIAEIIRYHHEKVDCKACSELQILCLADSLIDKKRLDFMIKDDMQYLTIALPKGKLFYLAKDLFAKLVL